MCKYVMPLRYPTTRTASVNVNTTRLAIYVDVLTVIYSYIPDELPEENANIYQTYTHMHTRIGLPDNMAHYVYCPKIK